MPGAIGAKVLSASASVLVSPLRQHLNLNPPHPLLVMLLYRTIRMQDSQTVHQVDNAVF